MSKKSKIICAILTVLVIVAGFMIYAKVSNKLSFSNQKTAERDKYLAILVNNGDYPKEFVEEIANVNGFDGYDGLVSYLVSKDEVCHIPAFTYKGEDYEYKYPETYAIKGTVVYCDAVEMGVIPTN